MLNLIIILYLSSIFESQRLYIKHIYNNIYIRHIHNFDILHFKIKTSLQLYLKLRI